MREVYLSKDENVYECPYCNVEIVDYTGENETRTEYCGKCLKEFKIIIED